MNKNKTAANAAPQTDAISMTTVKIGKPDADGKQRKENYGFQPEGFSLFIGNLITEHSETVSFPMFGSIVTVPAATNTVDKTTRFLRACKVAAAVLFIGMDSEEILPQQNKDGHKFLDGIKSTGIKFGCRSRSSVMQAINAKIALKAQVIGLQKDATNKMNSAIITATNTVKEARKIMKEKGIEEARNFLAGKNQPVLLEKY